MSQYRLWCGYFGGQGTLQALQCLLPWECNYRRESQRDTQLLSTELVSYLQHFTSRGLAVARLQQKNDSSNISNELAAGLARPPKASHGFFSFLQLFKHTLYNNFKQAVGSGVLQTFSTCAVKPQLIDEISMAAPYHTQKFK